MVNKDEKTKTYCVICSFDEILKCYKLVVEKLRVFKSER